MKILTYCLLNSNRDAIAKALYSRLFTWLVERVNMIVCRAEREKRTSLAVLDIFGFEVWFVLSNGMQAGVQFW